MCNVCRYYLYFCEILLSLSYMVIGVYMLLLLLLNRWLECYFGKYFFEIVKKVNLGTWRLCSLVSRYLGSVNKSENCPNLAKHSYVTTLLPYFFGFFSGNCINVRELLISPSSLGFVL